MFYRVDDVTPDRHPGHEVALMQHQLEAVLLLHVELPTHPLLTHRARHEHFPNPVEIQVTVKKQKEISGGSILDTLINKLYIKSKCIEVYEGFRTSV